MANDVNDPFGTNHPGALVVLGLSTVATFATMAWMGRKNEEAHQDLQAQLNDLSGDVSLLVRAFKKHERDDTRHITAQALAPTIRQAPPAGARRPRFIVPNSRTLRSFT